MPETVFPKYDEAGVVRSSELIEAFPLPLHGSSAASFSFSCLMAVSWNSLVRA